MAHDRLKAHRRGHASESWAALRYRILARRLKTRGGEIDLVVAAARSARSALSMSRRRIRRVLPRNRCIRPSRLALPTPPLYISPAARASPGAAPALILLQLARAACRCITGMFGGPIFERRCFEDRTCR